MRAAQIIIHGKCGIEVSHMSRKYLVCVCVVSFKLQSTTKLCVYALSVFKIVLPL